MIAGNDDTNASSTNWMRHDARGSARQPRSRKIARRARVGGRGGRRGGVRPMVAGLAGRCRRASMRRMTPPLLPPRARSCGRSMAPSRGSPPNIKKICRPFGPSSGSLPSTSAGVWGVGGAFRADIRCKPLRRARRRCRAPGPPCAFALVVAFFTNTWVSLLEKIATVLRRALWAELSPPGGLGARAPSRRAHGAAPRCTPRSAISGARQPGGQSR